MNCNINVMCSEKLVIICFENVLKTLVSSNIVLKHFANSQVRDFL